MEKVSDISKNNKYFWFYPKSRSEIKYILNINSKSKAKTALKEKLKNKTDLDLVLVEVKHKEKTSKIFPENVFVHITFYQVRNGRFSSVKNKLPGIIFFKNSFINKNGFKTSYLKNIVKKFYFDGLVTKPMNFKYYSNI